MQMKLPTLAALCLVTLLAGCSAHQKKEIKEGFTEVGHATKDAAKKPTIFSVIPRKTLVKTSTKPPANDPLAER